MSLALLFSKLRAGSTYTKEHPNLIVIMAVLLVFPLLFWYTNQQYLEAGQKNLERVQKDRVGLMHDVVASLLYATDFNTVTAQTELTRIAALNPDIKEFTIAKQEGSNVISLASLDAGTINEPEPNPQFYKNSLVNVNESIIFPALENGEKFWHVYRALETQSSDIYFMYTKLSLAAVNASINNNIQSANWSLVYLYFAIGLLVFWHIKMTDYRYLYQQSKEANELKDQFTNMMAHELRAPLTAIRGYANMLTERLEGENKQYAERVKISSQRLLSIINDLLDVARIQSGKLAISHETVIIPELIDKVIAELGISAAEKNIQLTKECNDSALSIEVDSKRLQQVFTNLVSNAIKYTKEGEIKISATMIRESVEIRVKDTGMGIAAEDQKSLFAPFFRVKSAAVQEITGTGLGMMIAKELVELMGGTILVESIRDVGTHIVLKLPAKKV